VATPAWVKDTDYLQQVSRLWQVVYVRLAHYNVSWLMGTPCLCMRILNRRGRWGFRSKWPWCDDCTPVESLLRFTNSHEVVKHYGPSYHAADWVKSSRYLRWLKRGRRRVGPPGQVAEASSLPTLPPWAFTQFSSLKYWNTTHIKFVQIFSIVLESDYVSRSWGEVSRVPIGCSASPRVAER